jgi:expansin (peptidoglycan-binding protein)
MRYVQGPSDARTVTFTSTPSYVAVTGIDGSPNIREFSIQNMTDGDIAIRFGSSGDPHYVVTEGMSFINDSDENRGQMYIKNLTGTGGTVYVRAF